MPRRDSEAPPLDFDWRLRHAAFHQLRQLAVRGGGLVTRAEMVEGFEFESERIRYVSAQAGIWRPQQLATHGGAALSVLTQPKVKGRRPAYDDEVASDSDRFHYRYEGTDPDFWTNVAVRRAFQQGRPLIYFYGIRPGLYEPMFCDVMADRPDELTFELLPRGSNSALVMSQQELAVSENQRRWGVSEVKVRLHQRRFREEVLAAYGNRCTVCSLRHPELLDAAHILEDKHERGLPEVPNGLALCKIHHGAFDVNILGISPEYRIEIRGDILAEHDGPMLRHGLQDMNGVAIRLPRAAELRPRPEYLAERFDRFKAA